jgi:alpha-glucosidase
MPMDWLHPPVAPWLRRDAQGLHLTLMLRGASPQQLFVRTLPDHEEALLPLRAVPALDAEGWRAFQAFVPWDGGNENTAYAFKRVDGLGSRWLGADGEHPQVPPLASHFRVNRLHTPPDWVADQVFYQVFPDRFARGDEQAPVPLPPDVPGQRPNEARAWGEAVPLERPTTVFYGGDLPGLVRRLGHVQDTLGATALYLNPVFRSRSNHKYDTESYDEVDPALGGNAVLAQLRDATAARGMRLVLDAVVNHTGAQHPWFAGPAGAHQGADAPYRRWYAFDDDGRALGWKGYDSLPVLDYAEPAVAQAMFEAPDAVMQRWLQAPFAIDGWRLDAVHMLGEGRGAGNNAAVLRRMRRAVKAAQPEAYLVGEHFNEASAWLQGDQEDGAMNYYGFAHPLRMWLAGLDLNHHRAALATADFGRWLRQAMAAVPWANQLAQLNLLDSHDTPRLLTLLEGDVDAMKIAVTLLMAWPGSPCVYYGDEIGLEGGPDPDCRRCFDWNPAHWQQALLAHYQAAIRRRHSRAELRRGAFVELAAEGDLYAFARFDASAATLVAVNRGAQPATLRPAWPALPNGVVLPAALAVPARGSAAWCSA